MYSKQFLENRLSEEVSRAFAKGRPVVALESTIITHGMPYPENLNTAIELEELLRAQGVCPATIAVIQGAIKVGLSREELEFLAKIPSEQVFKLSTKDISYAIVKGIHGSTTVAATMDIAHKSGIQLFATGGIGGVHRNYEQHLDVSADLEQLSSTPVAVVCAGAKSILDISKTLEYLETKSVAVIGYGTSYFPSFYSLTKEFPLDLRMDTPKEIAELVATKKQRGEGSGLLIANPIPVAHALDEGYIRSIIQEGIKEMETKKISGKAVTPFLLQYIAERTEKQSLFSNIELVKNNVRLAGEIARALAA